MKVRKIDAPEPSSKKRLGFMAGQIITSKDFDEMGKEEITKLFGME